MTSDNNIVNTSEVETDQDVVSVSSKSSMGPSKILGIWRHLPRLVWVYATGMSCLLGFGLMTALAVGNVVVHQGYDTVAFATPTVDHKRPWGDKVRGLGRKVSGAFGVKSEVAYEFAGWIMEASVRQELDPELIASLVHTESTFRKKARSHVGAVGPAQIRPDYWGRFCGVADLTDPEQNIYCGAQVLSHLRERCNGDSICALRAYNIGLHSRQEQAGRRYLAKIDRYHTRLQNYSL